MISTGCTDTSQAGAGSAGSLEVSQLSVQDSSLQPGQTTRVEIEIANINDRSIELEKPSLYNLGDLEVTDTTCQATEIRGKTEDLPGSYTCAWTIEAPTEESLNSLNSKSYTFSASLEYNTSYQSQVIPLKFEQGEINSVQEKSLSSGNGEISLDVDYSTPMPKTGDSVDISIQTAGSGRVVERSSGDFNINYDPSRVVDTGAENCLQTADKPAVGNTRDLVCPVSTESPGSSVTQRLTVDVFYMYARAPSKTVRLQK